MPFLKTEKGLRFEFPAGLLRGTRWEIAGQVCQSPTCPCKVLDLGLHPVSDTSEPGDFERRISLDLGLREIGEGGSADDRLFAESLVAQLEAGDWDVLESIFSLRKEELYEAADLTDLDYEFSVEEIESKGLLISYNDVLPFHNRPRFEVEETSYLAVDQYPLGRSTQSVDPVITFCAFGPGPGGGPDEAREQFSISMDLTRRQWRPYDTLVPPTIPAERIVSVFLAQFDYDFLAERQRTLRALYRRNHGEKLGPVVPTEKVGRNDPCPCGSGRKYKKCCGG